MNIYQLVFDQYEWENEREDISYDPILMVHSKSYSQSELQKIVKMARMDMEHYPTWTDFPRCMEKYGFKQIVTGYFQ